MSESASSLAGPPVWHGPHLKQRRCCLINWKVWMWNSNSLYTRGSDIKAYVKVYVTAWLWKMSEDFPITNISGPLSLQKFHSICAQSWFCWRAQGANLSGASLGHWNFLFGLQLFLGAFLLFVKNRWTQSKSSRKILQTSLLLNYESMSWSKRHLNYLVFGWTSCYWIHSKDNSGKREGRTAMTNDVFSGSCVSASFCPKTDGEETRFFFFFTQIWIPKVKSVKSSAWSLIAWWDQSTVSAGAQCFSLPPCLPRPWYRSSSTLEVPWNSTFASQVMD